ncbi:hypothetical protein ACFRKB_30345 [Streptomyces scopuliridis]|uniref:hypothetical protein n=1 Tax=Streptomyces scopuliridis TaxID=452529 RepID=UPI0036C18736
MYMNNLRRAAMAACAAGAISLIVVSPASATGKAQVYTNQSEAGRVTYWTSTDDFRVSDTKCDSRSVYAQYQRAGAKVQTLRHSGGCRTYKDFNRSFTKGQTIKYRACVDIPARDDICGRWKWDTTG